MLETIRQLPTPPPLLQNAETAYRLCPNPLASSSKAALKNTRCGGSSGDVVAHRRCSGSQEMWWLIGSAPDY